MKKIFLILIFCLALFLRVYKLGTYPVGFLWDEAGLGYNAYSILETGKDEYGKWFPLIFKSFGDFKPGLYIYLTVPSVLIFGLNEFSVRLPSAIFGFLSVVFFCFLIKQLQKNKTLSQFSNSGLPIFAAILLTISPWHLNFSRGSWELNVMLFEVILGFFLLVKYLNSLKKFWLFSSAICFVLTFFTYQSAKLLTPVLLAGFLFFFRNQIKNVSFKYKAIFTAIVFAGFLIINSITLLNNMGGRLKVMSVFSYPRSPLETSLLLDQDNQQKLPWALFHSSPIYFTRSVLGRYFNYFSPDFLFLKGDWSNPRNGVVYQGVLYYFDFFFLILGLYLIFSRKPGPWENFMIFWLLVAPISAALTRDSISSVRSFTMVIPLIYLTSLGMMAFFDFTKKKKTIIRKFSYLLVFGIYLLLFVRFVDLYLIHDPITNSKDRLYGYKQLMKNVDDLGAGKDKIIISTKYGQPYIFYLFYTLYDPLKYQAQAKLTESPSGDVGKIEKIDNLEFREIYWPNDRAIRNSLFAGDEFDLPINDIVGQEGIYFAEEIKFVDGQTAFRIVETKKDENF